MANEFIIRKGYKSLSDSQITGSLSVSNAVTASFFTGSFRGDGSELTGIDGFPFTGSASISGSLTVVGPVTATEFIGNGSQLTGIEGFPYTGSAIISGSLQVTGSISTDTDATINSLTVGKGGGNQENNTVLGYEALISNVEGEGNVAVGYKALSSSLAGMGPNTAVGNQALRDNVYGFRNTAVGNAVLFSNTSGIFNTAVGNTALGNNTGGSYNNAVGDGALSENIGGENNIAIGHDALHDNTEGDNNVSIGNSSLYNNITGSNNTAIGTDAGQYAGASVTSLTSVDNSIFIGYQSRALNAVGDTNEIVIGHNIVGLGSNTTVIGNNSTVSTTLKGVVSASLFSGSFAGDGSQLTGIDGFPFTGSAAITGSLTVVGPVNATSFTGSIQGTATTASYVNIANVDGFTAYSSSVNTAIGSVLDATTPLTATINNTNSPFTITSQSIVIVDSTNGNVTVNLPNLNTVVGTPNQKPIVVYKNDYSQNVIFVSPSGSQLINGASQDIIVSIQLAVIYNPTSAGWVTEGTSAQSLAELELFFVPKTETGSLSVATASYVEYTDVVNKPTLVSGSSQISFSGITNKPTLVSGSSQISFTGITNKPTLVSGSSQITYSGLTGKPSGIVSSSVQVKEYNVFATTGSNQFNGNQSITGSLTVSGQVVAQTLNVQQVTSSIVYSSGSNIFGNNSGNTHRFTGSLAVTGSLTVAGAGSFSSTLATGGNITVTANSAAVRVTESGGADVRMVAGGSSGFFGTYSNHPLQFLTDSVTKLTLSSTGNLGLGVTPSAWNSAYRAIQFGTTGAIFGESGDAANYFTTNTFVDAVGFKYITSDFALGYFQENGVHSWRTAPSGTAGNAISFTQVMTLTAAGRLGIGQVSPDARLHVEVPAESPATGAVALLAKTSNGANDIFRWFDGTTPLGVFKNNGNVLIGTTTDNGARLQVSGAATISGNVGLGTSTPFSVTNFTTLTINGTNASLIEMQAGGTSYARIQATSSEMSLLARGGTPMVFYTNPGSDTERMRITSGGNVGIGTSSPVARLEVTGLSASPNNGFFVTTNSYTSLSSGSVLRIGHVASSGNTTAIIQNLTVGGTTVGNIAFPNGNVLIGTATDNGRKLNVNGSGLFSGILSTAKVEVGAVESVNITTNSTFTLVSSSYFNIRTNILVSVTIRWDNNANAQRQYLLFIGATDTGWGTPNSAISVIASNDWSSGYVGAATFSIGGSGQSRTLNISVANAATYNVTANAAIIDM